MQMHPYTITDLIRYPNDTTIATTAEEILALGKAGWQKYDEATIAGVTMHFYRKPKRFGGSQNRVDKSEKQGDRFLCSA